MTPEEWDELKRKFEGMALAQWRIDHPHGYNAVDHQHTWAEHENGDAFCGICGLWRSQVTAL